MKVPGVGIEAATTRINTQVEAQITMPVYTILQHITSNCRRL